MKESVIESGLNKCKYLVSSSLRDELKHLLTIAETRTVVASYAVVAVCAIIASTNGFYDKMCESCLNFIILVCVHVHMYVCVCM